MSFGFIQPLAAFFFRKARPVSTSDSERDGESALGRADELAAPGAEARAFHSTSALRIRCEWNCPALAMLVSKAYLIVVVDPAPCAAGTLTAVAPALRTLAAACDAIAQVHSRCAAACAHRVHDRASILLRLVRRQ